MSNLWLRVLQVVGVLPGLTLVACASVYVFTGGDPLPGDEGGRWVALVGLAMAGGLMTMFAGIEIGSRAGR